MSGVELDYITDDNLRLILKTTYEAVHRQFAVIDMWNGEKEEYYMKKRINCMGGVCLKIYQQETLLQSVTEEKVHKHF